MSSTACGLEPSDQVVQKPRPSSPHAKLAPELDRKAKVPGSTLVPTGAR
jgi:hypothetical protein